MLDEVRIVDGGVLDLDIADPFAQRGSIPPGVDAVSTGQDSHGITGLTALQIDRDGCFNPLLHREINIPITAVLTGNTDIATQHRPGHIQIQ
ncbi:MAG: hypothetical protein AAFX99_17690, partial [Myxococcota bacterium]